jgi:pyrroline-5-carboxylate reductase
MYSQTLTLLLVGCGKMGSALLARWPQQFADARFDVIDPAHTQRNTSQVNWHKNLDALPQDYAPGVVVFAVKPQQLGDILPAYGKRFGNAPLYISIAAGKNLQFLTSGLGGRVQVVRAMPNTPALVGQGMTALCANGTLPASARNIAAQLMLAVGKVEWINNEGLMDAVTALSGCGPAYMFLFLESLVEAGVDAGLPENVAKSLILQTAAGSLALAGQTHENFEQLCKNVMSPGGATEAAITLLKNNNILKSIMKEAVLAATKKSKELG